MSSSSNSKIYRIGDYVYVETAPVYPYQIRRIEELTKLGNGQIEAKVQCFYRRRDLSTPLIAQADRHAASAEEDAEIDMGSEELDDTKIHQLSHRELFLSRQYETINASQIRGKCLVALYCETEVLSRYSGKEDWFYYCLVYDPQQKALLADKGETGVGTQYQPVVPAKLEDTSIDTRDLSQLETMVWTTKHKLTDREVDQFLVVSRSVGTFARALDCSSSVKQPSLHMSAAAASRDITQFHALSVLHKSSYDVSKAVACLVPTGGPVLCRDEMEEWSAGEAGLFEEAITKYGKDFSDIQKDFLPWKSISSIIEYYYMWKTTDRYVRQKRLKTVEKESDLKQILVSNPPGTTCITGSGDKESVNSIPYPPPGVLTKPPTPNHSCESCYANTSTHWFPWTTANNQYKHYVCSVCWVYWKKYGGLKKPDGFSSRSGEEARYTCRLCGKVFNRAERLSNHMVSHKPIKCFVDGCDKSFNTKANFTRHLSSYHAMRPPSPTRAKPKNPFFMNVLPLTKLSRYLCPDLLKFPHLARVFNVNLNSNEIRQACVEKVSSTNVADLIKRKRVKERKPLEKVVEVLKTRPPKAARDVSTTSSAPSHMTKTRSKASSSNHQSPMTSPTRKLLHSSRLYVAQGSGKDLKESRSSQAKHLLSRKRSIESSSVQHNGIDAPATKRFISNSPLGKKGCECTQCGKVLHNQASLSHHMQSVHAISPLVAEAGPPKQKSYPAYCDVNPGMGPGVTKMAPYAEHTVTSYNTNIALANPAKTLVNVSKLRPPILTKPVVPLAPKAQPPNSQPLGSNVNRKSYSAPSKNHSSVNGTSQNRSRGRLSPTRQPQFIDPPEEFVFSSTKIIRSSRKKLTDVVKRRLPRKPWMEVKCSTELKELIFRSRKPKRGKAADLTIPPNPDVVEVDGKMVSPVKGEIKPVEPGVPETTGSTQSPGVPETSAPLQGSSLGLKNLDHSGNADHSGKLGSLGNSDASGTISGPEKPGNAENSDVPGNVEGKLGTPIITQVTSIAQGNAGAPEKPEALGKPSGLGNSGGGVPSAVEPIVIDD